MFTTNDNVNHLISFLEQIYPYPSLHSPLINYYEIDDGLFTNHADPSTPPSNSHANTTGTATGMDANNNNDIKGTYKDTNTRDVRKSRRRSSMRDRHSKINTAQGLRDRRMRLSYEVACEFFKLQDKLGFDKASTTVKWLLMESKPAIEDLYRKSKLVDENTGVNYGVQKESECCNGSTLVHKVKKKIMRRNAFDPLAKQSREEARARARERTVQKKMKARTSYWQREPEIPFENGEKSAEMEQPNQSQRDPNKTVEPFNGTFAGNCYPLTTFNWQQNCEVNSEWEMVGSTILLGYTSKSLEEHQHKNHDALSNTTV
ncbi:hypothetical protein Nepgr_033439 [Nepenthes gracilis]|uniref:Cycloidea-like protein n=1 Tax=Nepenthes gracilis TaxID=150966 RepID=A0AAD3TKG3_NEPGR|nr:hypothetical protein Nepgr_033439 [Nepenthes gracilis]